MNMESLTKTQIVLLVLLVSFVTSLATGIVTVTLVNQAPQPITHTINKVVEKLVPKEVPIKEKTVFFSNEENLVKIIKIASLAVVSITATTTATTTSMLSRSSDLDPDLEHRGSVGAEKIPAPNGSGFFVSKDGIILTNKHIVGDETLEYVVMTSEGKTYLATVISRNSSQDIAILKVEGNNFNFIPLGDSKNINVGQTAVAIGSDSGEFQNTVSVGIVSGLNKMAAVIGAISRPEDSVALIQIDATTNPGNSGGPLIDLNGKAIGINTVGAPRGNIGFALPINLAKKDLSF